MPAPVVPASVVPAPVVLAPVVPAPVVAAATPAPAKAPPVFRESLEAPGPATMTPAAQPVTPAQRARRRMLLGVVLLLALAAGTFAFTRLPSSEDAPAPVAVAPPTPAPPAPAPPPEAVRAPARDPWQQAGPLDDILVSVRERLDNGDRPSQRALRSLAAYANNHPTDPLPRLLLARAFAAQGWLKNAIPELEQAFALDPSVRGDPQALLMLIRMMDSASYHVPAATLIRTHYGVEARPALRAAIASGRRPASIERLVALEANL